MPNTRRSAQLEPMDVENPALASNRRRTALVSQSLFEPFVYTFKRSLGHGIFVRECAIDV
jgi:hypothetical protein